MFVLLTSDSWLLTSDYNGLTTRRNLNWWKPMSAVRISTTPCSRMSAAI